MEHVRQDILRVGKQPGQGLEVRRRAWEGGDKKTGLSGAEWVRRAARGLECQTEALTPGLLGREWLGGGVQSADLSEANGSSATEAGVWEGAEIRRELTM